MNKKLILDIKKAIKAVRLLNSSFEQFLRDKEYEIAGQDTYKKIYQLQH